MLSNAAVRPLRSDAAKNRERLLKAAGRVFEEQGLEASVADVARAAGVGMGTFYRRFPTKDALIEALVTEVLAMTISMAKEAAGQPDGSGLEHFLEASSRYQAEHVGCLPRLWSADHELIRVARRLIADLLADAKAQKLELAPLLGADLQRLNEDTFKASPKAVETARQIMGP